MGKSNRATQPPRASDLADEACASKSLPELCPRAYSFKHRPATLELFAMAVNLKFTQVRFLSSAAAPGVVLPLAQSLATAGPNHSDIDPIHIPEISVRTCRLHMPHKTLARDRRC